MTSASGRDSLDLVIETLADSEYTLARECAGLREVLHVAIEQLREVTGQLERLREQHRHLRDEYRQLRKQMLLDERRVA